MDFILGSYFPAATVALPRCDLAEDGFHSCQIEAFTLQCGRRRRSARAGTLRLLLTLSPSGIHTAIVLVQNLDVSLDCQLSNGKDSAAATGLQQGQESGNLEKILGGK